MHGPYRPCLHEGTCVELGADYACNCTALYGGRNCETYIPCGSAPCLNGASCVNNASNAAYQCVCGENYAGRNCEQVCEKSLLCF